jgi:hypothetical protein
MILGIDFHDTITYNPDFFKTLIKSWNDKIYIVTGTPASRKNEVVESLLEIGIDSSYYEDILLGFEYEKSEMTVDHFKKMREHKLKIIKEYNIGVYFDDNPFYVEHLRNHGVLVFQTIISDNYLKKFEEADAFFTCNLQAFQFDYLKHIDKHVKRK